HHGERNLRLHHREVIPDAETGTAAKREVRILRLSPGAPLCEAVGIEPVGIVPNRGMALGNEWAEKDHRAGRNIISVDSIAADRLASEHPRRRIKAQRFLKPGGNELLELPSVSLLGAGEQLSEAAMKSANSRCSSKATRVYSGQRRS